MSVYLGDDGCVQICRTGEPVGFALEADDVDIAAKRMSVEFGGPPPFVTGDQVEVIRTDGDFDLQLLAGVDDCNFTRFIHIDQVGGIRFYDTFADAIQGGKAGALDLVQPTEDQEIFMKVVNLEYQQLAQMREWEITTTRETVDTSVLGEEYRSFYDQGMISGQGSIGAIWDYKRSMCDKINLDSQAELAQYFAQLIIRFKEGAKFKGHFYIYKGAAEAVWYEADCIVTNVAMSFAPGVVINSTIQFITTGMVQLKQGALPSYLLQEDTGLFDLEEGSGSVELEADLD